MDEKIIAIEFKNGQNGWEDGFSKESTFQNLFNHIYGYFNLDHGMIERGFHTVILNPNRPIECIVVTNQRRILLGEVMRLSLSSRENVVMILDRVVKKVFSREVKDIDWFSNEFLIVFRDTNPLMKMLLGIAETDKQSLAIIIINDAIELFFNEVHRFSTLLNKNLNKVGLIFQNQVSELLQWDSFFEFLFSNNLRDLPSDEVTRLALIRFVVTLNTYNSKP